MALNTQLATNAQAAAINAVTALLNSGFLDMYDGAQPANANTAITTQVKLASLSFGNPAAATTSTATATFNAITPDSDADATGTATWFRCWKSDHATVVYDGTVGTSGANVNINSVAIQIHATVNVSALTLSIPAAGA